MKMNAPGAEDKLRALDAALAALEGGALVALSGGLDSSFVLARAIKCGLRTLAVTGVSPTTPPQDIEDARAMTAALGAEHLMVETSEMSDPDFTGNSKERCYHCKRILFGQLSAIASARGIGAVLDGSTADDLNDYRPGRRAAAEMGVRSPLLEAGLSKDEIRAEARRMGLAVWDKPASPCLSSRFPYGVAITAGGLERVMKAEQHLRGLGFAPLRVRDHGGMARIEVPSQMITEAVAQREGIVAALKKLGYKYVSLDLEGFESGRLNRDLS